jgi:two-component system, NarL family, nitrate/nitrite response regulator NarL
MSDELRVAIVDNYPIFRDGMVQALQRGEGTLVVAEGATADEAELIAREKKPDVLLLEAAVPGSLKAAQAILQAHPKIKVIFLASIEDHEHAALAVQAGIHGYILKGITGPELERTLKAVQRGERYITPDLAWRMVTRPEPHVAARDASRKSNLSIREQQVLDCTSRGLTNQEIARTLGLALSTIKYYKTLAFRKVGARNRMEAIVASNKMGK